MKHKNPSADVFLLAAGKGERLRPLTDVKPKPLIEVGGKPIIAWNLELIERAGFKRVIVNTFYKREKIHEYFSANNWGSLEIKLVDEDILLGTGGGIKNIESELESDYLLTINSDILLGPDFDLRMVLREHINSALKPKVTLVLREDSDAEKFGAFGIDSSGRVLSFMTTTYREGKVAKRLMYTGVQALSREVFELMPPRGTVFALPQTIYTKLLAADQPILGLCYDGYWNDVGTPERLGAASNEIGDIFGIS